jgi:chaperonin GroES
MDTPHEVTPLADRVVVERAAPQDQTAGGVVLPDAAQEKPREGTVIAAGPGRMLENGKRRRLEVQRGDRVLFHDDAGSEIKIGGKSFVILREEEIIAVLAA